MCEISYQAELINHQTGVRSVTWQAGRQHASLELVNLLSFVVNLGRHISHHVLPMQMQLVQRKKMALHRIVDTGFGEVRHWFHSKWRYKSNGAPDLIMQSFFLAQSHSV